MLCLERSPAEAYVGVRELLVGCMLQSDISRLYIPHLYSTVRRQHCIRLTKTVKLPRPARRPRCTRHASLFFSIAHTRTAHLNRLVFYMHVYEHRHFLDHHVIPFTKVKIGKEAEREMEREWARESDTERIPGEQTSEKGKARATRWGERRE